MSKAGFTANTSFVSLLGEVAAAASLIVGGAVLVALMTLV